eukprot:jgi/Tetstr1/461317/TSEL_006444.t1
METCHSDAVSSVAWAPDGSPVASGLASGSLGGTLGTGRDSSTAGGTMQVLQQHTDPVRFVAWAPRGGSLASSTPHTDGIVCVCAVGEDGAVEGDASQV